MENNKIEGEPNSNEQNTKIPSKAQEQGTEIKQKNTNISKPPSNSKNCKKKIMCKFFMNGTCIKGENCIYLHDEEEKNRRVNNRIECPMFEVGFCKNGPLCQYKHTKKNESEMPEDILPIWFIEHYFDKPIEIIFKELKNSNDPEVIEINKKYGITPDINSEQFNPALVMGNYSGIKDNICKVLNDKDKYDILYYMIIVNDMGKINESFQNHNIEVEKDFLCKLPEINQENEITKNNHENKMKIIIFIIYCKINNVFRGYARYRGKISDNVAKIDWIWICFFDASKILSVKNKMDENHFLIDSKNGTQIDNFVGKNLCKMMMKKLTHVEVNQFLRAKNYKTKNKKQGKEAAEFVNKPINKKVSSIIKVEENSHESNETSNEHSKKLIPKMFMKRKRKGSPLLLDSNKNNNSEISSKEISENKMVTKSSSKSIVEEKEKAIPSCICLVNNMNLLDKEIESNKKEKQEIKDSSSNLEEEKNIKDQNTCNESQSPKEHDENLKRKNEEFKEIKENKENKDIKINENENKKNEEDKKEIKNLTIKEVKERSRSKSSSLSRSKHTLSKEKYSSIDENSSKSNINQSHSSKHHEHSKKDHHSKSRYSSKERYYYNDSYNHHKKEYVNQGFNKYLRNDKERFYHGKNDPYFNHQNMERYRKYENENESYYNDKRQKIDGKNSFINCKLFMNAINQTKK